MKKKVLSFVLTLAMVISLVPMFGVTAFAVDDRSTSIDIASENDVSASTLRVETTDNIAYGVHVSRVKLFFSPTAILPQIKSDISLSLSALI